MRKMTMLGVVAAALVGCGGGAPLTFNGNFTGLLTETDTCAGFGTNTYSIGLTWLIDEDTQAKTLNINSDGDCDKIQGSYSGEAATLSAVQCRTIQIGGGDTLAQRIDSGSLSLNADKDLAVTMAGSYVYSSPGQAPINCTYNASGTMYRFE